MTIDAHAILTSRAARVGGAAALVAALGFGGFAAAQSAAAMRADLPPSPKAGECYARVLVPGETRKVRREIIVQEASEELVSVPARYKWVQEPVVIEEGYERIEVIPARFEMQTRTVEVEPARREITVTQPRYETVKERVKIRDAYTTWKRDCDALRTDRGQDTLCGVTVPAEFKTVNKRVLREPARAVTRVIPAVTKEIAVRVVVEKARRRVVTVPPKRKLMRVRKLVSEARVERRRIPAKKRIEVETVKVRDDSREWRPVLCEREATPILVRELQTSLKRAGFDPGPIDGDLGPATLQAVESYQKRYELPQGGLLMETLQRLGVRS